MGDYFIKNKKTGRIERMPVKVWDVFTDKKEWDILQPEEFKTPDPVGKASRPTRKK